MRKKIHGLIAMLVMMAMVGFGPPAAAQSLNPSDYCGEPTTSPSDGSALYVWQDCEDLSSPNRRIWHFKMIGDGSTTAVTYQGQVTSGWAIKNLVADPAESGDNVTLNGKTIDFTNVVVRSWTDKFSASLHITPAASVTLTSQPSGSSILVGRDKKPVAVSTLDLVPFLGDVELDYEAMGFVDVTNHGATANDTTDDTVAIQDAIDQGLAEGRAVFFPSGTYRIREMLRGMMPVIDGKQDRRKPTVLIGSTLGSRPVIELHPRNGDNSFDRPSDPKPMLWLWAQPRDAGFNLGSTDPNDEQSSISFSQMVRGINLDLKGHSGAIGLRHACSQGCALSDSKITATGAYAGIFNPAGQGGGTYNVHVVGGQYGIMTDSKTKYPIIAGAIFENQTKAAIYLKTFMPLTMAGFHIKGNPDHAIQIVGASGGAEASAITLVDGKIELDQGTTAAIQNPRGKNIFLRDVFFGGSRQPIIKNGSAVVNKGVAGWRGFSEYVYTGGNGRSMIDGVVKSGGFETNTAASGSPSTTETIIRRHVWDDSTFPSFEDDGVVDPTVDPRYRDRVIADDGIDDTDGLQDAISENKKVFLPRGEYTLTDTLLLGADSVLLGSGKNFTRLTTDPAAWTTGDPIVRTVSSGSATTTMANVMLEVDGGESGSFVDWRAGKASYFRDNFFGRPWQPRTVIDADDGAVVTIRQAGGGRWYGVAGEWDNLRNAAHHPNYRGLSVAGTHQALSLYGLNVERIQSDVQVEVKNNSQNVNIYYLKAESFKRAVSGNTVSYSKPGGPDVLKIANSKVNLFGFSGNAAPTNQQIQVVDSPNYLLANIGGVADLSGVTVVAEKTGATTKRVIGYPAAVVRRGIS